MFEDIEAESEDHDESFGSHINSVGKVGHSRSMSGVSQINQSASVNSVARNYVGELISNV